MKPVRSRYFHIRSLLPGEWYHVHERVRMKRYPDEQGEYASTIRQAWWRSVLRSRDCEHIELFQSDGRRTLGGSRFLDECYGTVGLVGCPTLERQAGNGAFFVFLDQPRGIYHDERVVGDNHTLIKGAEMRHVSLVSHVREA